MTRYYYECNVYQCKTTLTGDFVYFLLKVLRTEQEIMELDHSGFSTQYPTVCAANLGDGRYILQVLMRFVTLELILLKGYMGGGGLLM